MLRVGNSRRGLATLSSRARMVHENSANARGFNTSVARDTSSLVRGRLPISSHSAQPRRKLMSASMSS
eukprot:6951377-Lingulodinium_polyedra.AAC.1